MTKEEKNFVDVLENLVTKRMTIGEIEESLNSYFGLQEQLIFLNKSNNWDNVTISDYLIIGSTEVLHRKDNQIPFCDFDIYLLPTKEVKNSEIVYYITEVGYEFQ